MLAAVALCRGSEPPLLPLEQQDNICSPPPHRGLGSARHMCRIPQTRRGWAPGEGEGL